MKKAKYGVQNLGNSVVSCEKIFKIIDELVLLLKKMLIGAHICRFWNKLFIRFKHKSAGLVVNILVLYFNGPRLNPVLCFDCGRYSVCLLF